MMGQAGVLPAICPDGAEMAVGWPTGFVNARAARRAKKFPFSPGANLGGGVV